MADCSGSDLSQARHDRDGGAVDVCIQKADTAASLCERDGEVDSYRGFAYAALSGADKPGGFCKAQRLHLLSLPPGLPDPGYDKKR